MNKNTAHNISQLKQLFPEVFDQDKIDWNKLKILLDEPITVPKETFHFTWSGKKQAVAEAQTKSTATLKVNLKESINFNSTQHIYIEGDNLEVLKLIQEEYKQKIKLIYIDPPYNTGKDFVYNDNFRTKTAKKQAIMSLVMPIMLIG